MARYARIVLPPTATDRAIARVCERHASPPLERAVGIVSWLADEKAVLAAAGAFWLATRFSAESARREADRMLCGVMLAGAVPHIGKFLVDRERPNRTIGRASRNGIPRLGNAWDSFPSGHAVHLGAMAGSVARLAPPQWRPWLWSGFGALAATRVMLLAHYPTDVLAGWGIGIALNNAVGAFFRRARRR
jgi:membrane-associated phospholipid phosphatase